MNKGTVSTLSIIIMSVALLVLGVFLIAFPLQTVGVLTYIAIALVWVLAVVNFFRWVSRKKKTLPRLIVALVTIVVAREIYK